MMRHVHVWIAVLMAVSLCAGCREDTAKPASQDRPELLLFCGAGLRPPVDVLIQDFSKAQDVRVTVDYAGSEVLLSKIKLSRQGDLYMPGDERYTDAAADQGLVASRRRVCHLVPSILVAKDNPKGIRSLADLARKDVRVGFGDPRACSIGVVSQELLRKHGMGPIESLARFQSVTVNELAVHVQTGSLDAAVVWDAVARQYARHTTEVEIPIEHNIVPAVDIAVLTSSKALSLAEAFAEFASSTRAREIFRQHGYRVDETAALRGGAR
jgi:molybdate transport system substrate-binding protein